MARWTTMLGIVTVGIIPCTAIVAQDRGTPPSPAGPTLPAAQSSRGVEKKTPTISLDVKDQPLANVVRTLGQHSGLGVVFDQELPVFSRRITVRIANKTTLDAFAQVLQGTGMVATISSDGETVMVRPRSDSIKTREQRGRIQGKIVDSATRAPLAGVTLTIRELRQSVASTPDGSFLFTQVPPGEYTVVAKFLGYKEGIRTVHVADNRSPSVQIVLTPTAMTLSGVVTTATGKERRIEVGNDITVLNVDSLMKTAPIASVTDLLEARVPGMTVQRTSGTPGDPARIRIRGTSSIYQNNDPIVIVDGIRMYSQQSDERNINQGSGSGRSYSTPSPIDQIDPNTIETIEVFKGPSASALYGSDAANGVIVITTKRGRAGVPVWNISANAGMTHMPGKWPETFYRWSTPIQGGGPVLCVGFCPTSTIDSVVPFQALNDPRLTVLGHGRTLGGAVTVSGGSQTIQYSFTGTTSNEDGILKLPKIEEERFLKFHGEPTPKWMRRPDLLKSNGIQASVQVQITPTTVFGFRSILNNQTQHRSSMSSLSSLRSSSAVNELQRTYIDISQLNETPILGNPYERVISNNINLINSVQINIRPWSWLPVTSTFGMNTVTQNNETSLARDMVQGDEASGSWSGRTNVASGVTGNVNTTMPISRLLSLSLGLNFDRGRTNDQYGAFYEIPQNVSDPSEGADSARNIFKRETSERKSFGWFLEPKLNFKSRFFIMPGFRLDNNGLAGANAKLNGLPKMNFSWVASEESFFPFKDIVDLFRIRTAFGVSGVQPKPGDLNRLYRRLNADPLNGLEPLYGDILDLQYLGNTRLRPERGIELEGGIDADVWNNRINFIATYYRKRRNDAIISNNYAASVNGGGLIQMNVGDIENSGIELSVGAQIVERRMVGVGFNATFSRSRSRVVRLGNAGSIAASKPAELIPNSAIQYVVGYPVEGLWEVPIFGYTDLDGDGWLSPSEVILGSAKRYMGTTEPNSQFSFSPRITVLGGRVAVNALLSYSGGQMQSLAAGTTYGGKLGGSPFEYNLFQGPTWFDRQAAVIGLRGFAGGFTNAGFMQNVDILRFQSISLNVSLGKNMVRLIRARSMTLSLQGDNLGLWTNYIGVDPSVNGISGARGVGDTGQLPSPREWRLRIGVGY